MERLLGIEKRQLDQRNKDEELDIFLPGGFECLSEADLLDVLEYSEEELLDYLEHSESFREDCRNYSFHLLYKECDFDEEYYDNKQKYIDYFYSASDSQKINFIELFGEDFDRFFPNLLQAQNKIMEEFKNGKLRKSI